MRVSPFFWLRGFAQLSRVAVTWTGMLAVGCFLGSCSSAGFRLAGDGPASSQEIDDRLFARMNLTLEVPGGSAASGTSLDDLASEIESSCEYLRRTADTTASTRTGCSVADCTDHLCGAIESICRAETYMRLAASPTAQFPYSSDGLSTDGLAGVSAVTAEARAGLARMAIESAAASLDLVDRGINAYSGAATGACLNNPYDANLPATTTLGAAHAETFVAALAALQDANELYRSHAAAVGDSIISEYGPIEGADGNSHGENLALRGAAGGLPGQPRRHSLQGSGGGGCVLRGGAAEPRRCPSARPRPAGCPGPDRRSCCRRDGWDGRQPSRGLAGRARVQRG
jgi:hypothetical protein